MNKLLAKAIQIASEVFVDKFDKGGNPYILHCLWVMNNVRHLGQEAMICAVLHDLVEDTEWSIPEVRVIFGDFIANTLIKLTHWPDDSYEDYIKNMVSNETAVAIKLKDLEHNMKPSRLKGLTKKDHNRMDKYMRWYTYLKEI